MLRLSRRMELPPKLFGHAVRFVSMKRAGRIRLPVTIEDLKEVTQLAKLINDNEENFHRLFDRGLFLNIYLIDEKAKDNGGYFTAPPIEDEPEIVIYNFNRHGLTPIDVLEHEMSHFIQWLFMKFNEINFLHPDTIKFFGTSGLSSGTGHWDDVVEFWPMVRTIAIQFVQSTKNFGEMTHEELVDAFNNAVHDIPSKNSLLSSVRRLKPDVARKFIKEIFLEIEEEWNRYQEFMYGDDE